MSNDEPTEPVSPDPEQLMQEQIRPQRFQVLPPEQSNPIPASDEDRLSTAVEKEKAKISAHSPESRRAEDAWDTIPGREIEVDFPDAGYEALGEDKPERLAPVRPLRTEDSSVQMSGPVSNTYVGQVSSYVATPAVSVDVMISLPDGRSWSLNTSVEEGDRPFGAEEILAVVCDHLDSVEGMLKSSITPARRAALGLSGMSTVAVKDDPQA